MLVWGCLYLYIAMISLLLFVFLCNAFFFDIVLCLFAAVVCVSLVVSVLLVCVVSAGVPFL